ncbi:MAG: SOS response-associated peptidase [Candidatus Limnocylindrales bacterium]
MCGRFTQQRSEAELAELFVAEPLGDDPGGHYNVAPTDDASVIVEKGDRRAVARYRWGLVPHWATDPSIGSRLINARAETVGSSNAFRESLARRRCIVPVDGFYEWRRAGGKRQPFLIFAPDGGPLALAGLWSGWRDPEAGEVRRTFTIVTTAANEFMAHIHDRMPVVLPADAWAAWLDPALDDPGEAQGILGQATAVDLAAHPVSTLVNNVRNDGPELLLHDAWM